MNRGPIPGRSGVLSSVVVTGALLLNGTGCRVTQKEKPVRGTVDIAATQDQVRLRARALIDPMCGELEAAADSIIANTTNRAVKRAALSWKAEGVPALRKALFQPNPYTAMGDTWVLCHQMADYFESGPGKVALAEASAQAAATCRRMEEEIARVAASVTVSGDVSSVRAFLTKWAEEHPIRHSIAGRESTLSRVLEGEAGDSFSLTEAVAEMTTTVDDLNRRLEVYSDQLFRQARWEAERFKMELLSDLSADQAIPLAERVVKSAEQAAAAAERLSPAVERAAGVAAEVPKLLATEREMAIKAVQEELARAIQAVHEERIAALKELREALAQELGHTIREAVGGAVGRAERLAFVVLGATGLALSLVLLLARRISFRRASAPAREQAPGA